MVYLKDSFWPMKSSFWDLSSLTEIRPGPTAVNTPSPNHWTAREFPTELFFFFFRFYSFIYLLNNTKTFCIGYSQLTMLC